MPHASLRLAAPLSPLRPELQAVHLAARQLDASLVRHGGPAAAPDASRLASILAAAGLAEYAPLLPPPPPSLREYVAEVCAHVGRLSLLPSLLATLRLDASHDEEVWQLAHYSLALHLLTSALADDPRLFARVVASLRAAMRRRPRWWAHLTPFEHAKMLTVERTMEEYLAARREGAVRAGFGRLGLPLNILEAVLEDVRFGWRDNAMAGLALMRARPGQLGGRAALSRDGRRAVQMHLPLPEEWRDLYISWNLAFTSNYADSPFFAAAMLNPSVLGAEASEFMYYRALALYIHMAGQIIGRVEANAYDPSVPGQGQRDWRHPRLTAEWGALNLRAARRYEARRALCLRHARAEAWRAAWRRGAAWQSPPKAWPSSRKGAPLRS